MDENIDDDFEPITRYHPRRPLGTIVNAASSSSSQPHLISFSSSAKLFTSAVSLSPSSSAKLSTSEFVKSNQCAPILHQHQLHNVEVNTKNGQDDRRDSRIGLVIIFFSIAPHETLTCLQNNFKAKRK